MEPWFRIWLCSICQNTSWRFWFFIICIQFWLIVYVTVYWEVCRFLVQQNRVGQLVCHQRWLCQTYDNSTSTFCSLNTDCNFYNGFCAWKWIYFSDKLKLLPDLQHFMLGATLRAYIRNIFFTWCLIRNNSPMSCFYAHFNMGKHYICRYLDKYNT